MLRKNRNIRLSVSLVYLLMSIFASISEPDYTGCYVLNEVGVLKSNVGFFVFKANGRAPSGECNARQTFHTKKYRLKGGAQARQTRRGNEPHPQSNISIKN